jgi:hypothetical protein
VVDQALATDGARPSTSGSLERPQGSQRLELICATPRVGLQKRKLPVRASEPGVCHLGVVPPAFAAGMGRPKELSFWVAILPRVAQPEPFESVYATPSMLGTREERDVLDAIARLGRSRRRLTPGHVVGQLGFGFWVRPCDSPNEQGNAAGPGLWPLATERFPGCPRTERTRATIRAAFSQLRDFRNDIAHYQPIWDKRVLETHQRAIDLRRWMNLRLGAVTEHLSEVGRIFHRGPQAWRRLVEASFVAAG